MTKKKTEEARELSPEDLAHVRDLHERIGSALSLEQLTSNYRMSLGLPDAEGRKPGAREVLGALRLLADLLVPRPKASEEQRESASIVLACPYCHAPCACLKKDD